MAERLCPRTKCVLVFTVLLFLIGFTLSTAAHAQATSGAVTGSVSDSSGAMIAGAQVSLMNIRTGVIQKTTTDRVGNYQFLLVPPGLYAVEVESAGFKKFRRDGIIAEVNRSLAVPVTMEVGPVTEVMEVKDAGTPLLEPNTSAVGTVMDSKKVDELPLNGRNPLGLANLIPGVQGIGYFGGALLSTWRMGQVVIAGGTPLNNGFLIDGIANEKMTDYSAMAFLPVDATQEFKIISNNMSAEYGRTGGGIISFISKAGTNQYHGLLYEYVRNTVFDSNEFFQNKNKQPRTAEHINTFGGTFGGPIKKDKLFFFFSLDEYRERKAASLIVNSPTDAQRTGDFSNLSFLQSGSCVPITIYNPFTTTADPARPGQYIRQPFANNVIPPGMISPIATAALKYYPSPNVPGQACSNAQNLFLSSPVPINRSDVSIRADYNITATKRISGRFSRDILDWGFANYFGNIADTDGRHILDPRRTVVLEYTDTLTPTLLMDARIGVNREQEHTIAPGHNFDLTKLGFSQAYASMVQQGELGYGFPVMSMSDFQSFGRPDSTGNPTATGTAAVTLTKVQRSHNIKFGYEQRLYRRSDWGTSNASGNFTFGRGFTQANPTVASATTGYGLATLLLGAPTAGSVTVTRDSVDTMNYSALFVQDDWKATRKLTLNIGLRWEYEGPIKERHNLFPNFDPSVSSAMVVPGLSLKGGYTFPGTSGISNGVTDPVYSNFGPRLGFAYQFKPKTVVRGGYGISYIPTYGLGSSQAGASFGVTTTMITSLNNQSLIPTNTLANPFPNGLSQPVGSSQGTLTSVGTTANAGYLRDVHRGYAQEWNFTVQHEPWANWLFEAAYIGNKGTHLTTLFQNIDQLSNVYLNMGSQLTTSLVNNPFYGQPSIPASSSLAGKTITLRQSLLPFPQFTSVIVNNYLGDSIYHAFTFKVERRFSGGLSLLASYVVSKLIDDMAGTGRPGAVGGAGIQDWYNFSLERARSYQDVPQRFVATASWEIPFKPRNAILKNIVGGWQTNGIWTWQSGFPIGLSASSTGVNTRPNSVPGVSYASSNQSISQWFNNIAPGQPGAAFALPPAYTYGTVSRTLPNINGPRFFDIDASLFKTFSLTEKYKIQFRAEAYNLTNTPTFSVPVGSVTSATFGQVTSTSNGGPQHYRELQLALRFQF